MEVKSIKNKIKREEIHLREKKAKSKEKLKRRLEIKKQEAQNPELKKERLANNVPKTLENTREVDETIVAEDDEEVMADEEGDEFAPYFNGVDSPPKMLITTSKSPSAACYRFTSELVDVFPHSQFVKRGNRFEIPQIVQFCKNRKYTDLMIVNEDSKVANAITLIHLPDGPTAYFKLTNVKLSKEIQGHGRSSCHQPELILNNLNTRLGHRVGRLFQSLFPPVPEFQGRQVVTMHNQRDFIFFRRHRYEFRNEEKVNLQEIGPRFTLKLKWLQKGTFDRKGEYEWIFRQEMETSKRRFFL